VWWLNLIEKGLQEEFADAVIKNVLKSCDNSNSFWGDNSTTASVE